MKDATRDSISKLRDELEQEGFWYGVRQCDAALAGDSKAKAWAGRVCRTRKKQREKIEALAKGRFWAHWNISIRAATALSKFEGPDKVTEHEILYIKGASRKTLREIRDAWRVHWGKDLPLGEKRVYLHTGTDTEPKGGALPNPPDFKAEATAWLLQHEGHVPIGRDVALAAAFEAWYERGRSSSS